MGLRESSAIFSFGCVRVLRLGPDPHTFDILAPARAVPYQSFCIYRQPAEKPWCWNGLDWLWDGRCAVALVTSLQFCAPLPPNQPMNPNSVELSHSARSFRILTVAQIQDLTAATPIQRNPGLPLHKLCVGMPKSQRLI